MLNMIEKGGKMMIGTNNKSYGNLLLEFLPHTIQNEADYGAVQAEIDRLIDQGELSSAEEAYLDLLGTLVRDYETRIEDQTQYSLRGVALIKGLLELHDLKQKDLLPIFKTPSIVSAVLHGKRALTARQINELAAFFHLPQGLFFEPLTIKQSPSNHQAITVK